MLDLCVDQLDFLFWGVCDCRSSRRPRHCCRQRARRSKKHTTTTCRLFVDAAYLVGRSLDDAPCRSIQAHRHIAVFFRILLNCCADYSIFVDHPGRGSFLSCYRRLDDLPTSHEEKVGPRLTEKMQLMMILARKVAISLPLALVGDSKETVHSWSLRVSRYRAGHAT